MGTPISTIRNLGPAMDTACARAGIATAEEVRELGPDKTYARLLRSGMRAHFIGYYALMMGLQGRPWNDCRGAEKDALRARFDQIVAKSKPDRPPGIDAILDEIGVRPPSR